MGYDDKSSAVVIGKQMELSVPGIYGSRSIQLYEEPLPRARRYDKNHVNIEIRDPTCRLPSLLVTISTCGRLYEVS